MKKRKGFSLVKIENTDELNKEIKLYKNTIIGFFLCILIILILMLFISYFFYKSINIKEIFKFRNCKIIIKIS